MAGALGFKVRRKACSTCIYGKNSPLNPNGGLKAVEDEVRDPHIGFKGHRICHHTDDVCCRGFWNRYKNDFPAGQVAQRLDIVVFVDDDNFEKSK